MRSYHCSPTTVMLANISFIHLVACIVYIIMTEDLETPFSDSLTEEQIELKRRSFFERTKIYRIGTAIGIIILILWNPFSKEKL